MISRGFTAFVALSILAVSEPVLGRYKWLERDDRPVYLYPRRFDQEHPQSLTDLANACDGGVCATLAGQAVSTLLAAADECAQQDMADQIIDAAAQFDATTAANMISIAQQFRQAEKNTPPDFSVTPNILRNSVFCQKAPKNSQLNGLVQAQDPSNNPNVFFDPASSSSVTKGSQANTFPFGTSGSASSGNSSDVASSSSVASVASVATGGVLAVETGSTASCSLITVTVSATDVPSSTDAITVAVSGTTDAPASTATAAASSAIGNFGKCSVPQIEFATGFDGRKETSFQPVDKTSYNHGSADNIDIITQFMCDTLVNTCGADATAQATCAKAKTAADTVTAKTGGQADAFNEVFGINTDFAAVAEVDDQGNTVAAGAAATATASSAAAATEAVTTAASVETTAAASTVAAAATASSTAASSGNAAIGNFGKCSVPQIEFAVGFDGRKETSFQPVDKTSYNHGSADNIDIITQFMCDTLVNTCGADATAQATCASAKSAADTVTAKTGGQADAFNAVFGIKTDFAAVQEVDDQGNVVAGTGNVAASTSSVNNVAIATSAAPAASSTSATVAAAEPTKAAASSGGNLQTFTGNLGGVTAPTVTAAGNQFQVEGNAAFNSLSSALERSCDVQNNQCANAANSSGNQNGLTVAACNAQQAQCNAQANSSAA